MLKNKILMDLFWISCFFNEKYISLLPFLLYSVQCTYQVSPKTSAAKRLYAHSLQLLLLLFTYKKCIERTFSNGVQFYIMSVSACSMYCERYLLTKKESPLNIHDRWVFLLKISMSVLLVVVKYWIILYKKTP